MVFIRHHTAAAEVDEDEFFHSRESGGTVVSSALHLLHKIIGERYGSGDWNSYVAQASDGDNWDNDSVLCKQLLINTIMPQVQYYTYVEITDGPPQNLWEQYAEVARPPPQLRDAEDRHAGRHLSGVPRAVQEAAEIADRALHACQETRKTRAPCPNSRSGPST